MNNRNAAFTLLEILVVLAVLGFGMGLVVELTAKSARISERVEEDTFVQLACDNMMNSILAGNMTATVGVSSPIPDAPNWETTIELLDGPIEKLIAIRIVAQRYVEETYPSAQDPSVPVVVRTPDPARRYVIKEWARRAEIKTRVVKVSSTGETTAVDGTGETVANDLAGGQNELGGGLGAETYDPFASIDSAFGGSDANMPGANARANGVGGGLSGGLGGAAGTNDPFSGLGVF